MHDVIVVGGGHNGLTCAAYLAKAGKQVLVCEANAQVGGFVITDEFPGAPGFLMNTFAFEFPFRNIRPSVTDELDLARFGLRWTSPDPHNTHMHPDGASFSLYQDLDRTHASMAKLSRHDADYYVSWMRPIMDVLYAAIPYLTDHPTRPSPQTIATLVARLAKGRKNLFPGARILMSSPLQILDGFEREEFKAFFGMNVVTGAFRPLDERAEDDGRTRPGRAARGDPVLHRRPVRARPHPRPAGQRRRQHRRLGRRRPLPNSRPAATGPRSSTATWTRSSTSWRTTPPAFGAASWTGTPPARATSTNPGPTRAPPGRPTSSPRRAARGGPAPHSSATAPPSTTSGTPDTAPTRCRAPTAGPDAPQPAPCSNSPSQNASPADP